MRADKDAFLGDFPQLSVKPGPVSPCCDRVDPDQHTLHSRELLAHLVHEFIAVDGGFRFHADSAESFCDAAKMALLQAGSIAGLAVTVPQERDSRRLFVLHPVSSSPR
jgi:hypothetical protein